MAKKKKTQPKLTGVLTLTALVIIGLYFSPIADFVGIDTSQASPIIEILRKAGLGKVFEKGPKQKNIPVSTSPAPGEMYDKKTYQQLAALDFSSGEQPVVLVNQNRSTLAIDKWQKNQVIYGDLDDLNRTTYVSAFLDQKNLGRSSERDQQVWRPTGWHQKKVNGQPIYNRGHLLAYTASFNFDQNGNYAPGQEGSQDNPKNLATQSAYSNQTLQTRYELLVRKAQGIKGNRVFYQIVTVFRGDELMPRGFWLQAIDSKKTLDFNVYLLNVQPSVVFDYQTGTSKIDRSMTIPDN